MEQIDMFDTQGAHEISEYTELDSDRLHPSVVTRNDRRVIAAFGPRTRNRALEDIAG